MTEEYEKRVRELERRVTLIEKDDALRDKRLLGLEEDSSYRRNQVKDIFDDIAVLKEDRSETRVTLKNIEDKLNRLEGKVDAVLEKPGKRWDSVIGAAIAAVVAFIIGIVLGG